MVITALGDAALRALLDDDAPNGDLTTQTLDLQGGARVLMRARQEMCACALEEAARLFELCGAIVRLPAASGDQVRAGEPLLEAFGSAAQLHLAWKTAQVLIEWASGISTATAAIVAAARSAGRVVPVACTRKNVPGTKALSIKAVRAGGAIVHRLGLSETLLVFAEHRLFLDETPAATVARLRQREPEKKIVVEVGSVPEAMRWARAGVDVLQLEKFEPVQVAECRSQLGADGHCLLAPAGGIRADNAATYVAAGADLLVTSAPYTAAPRDVQVTFERLP